MAGSGQTVAWVKARPCPSFCLSVLLENGVVAKLLVIEDDVALLAMLDANLTARGYEVLTASFGEKGLELASHLGGQLDLVMLDLMLPGISGWDAMRALRRHRTPRSVPILTITALPNENGELLSRRLEAAEYLMKPLSIGTLLNAINLVLGEGKFHE